MFTSFHIILLGLAAICAGTVDTIVGGGGLFTLPTLLAVGLSPALALGTNQFTLSFGALIGTWRYARKGSLRWWPQTILCAAGVIPGAWIGGHVAMAVPASVLHLIVLILLVGVGVLLMVYRRDPEELERPKPLNLARGILLGIIGIVLGFYEGFFGPGTGLFITMTGVVWLRLRYIEASGTAKAVSLVGNVTAFLTYATHHDVAWIIGLGMALFVSLGAYLGAWLAHRGGARIIRRVMFGIIGLIAANVVRLLLPHQSTP